MDWGELSEATGGALFGNPIDVVEDGLALLRVLQDTDYENISKKDISASIRIAEALIRLGTQKH